jgi:hypothetical protein
MNVISTQGRRILSAVLVLVGAGVAPGQSAIDGGVPGAGVVELDPASSAALRIAHADTQPTPLWERLAAFDQATRENALLELELPATAPAQTQEHARLAESLWQTGAHEAAVRLLRSVEATGIPIDAGVGWKVPRPLGGGLDGRDVRLGAPRGDFRITEMDVDPTTGNIFAIVHWPNGWSLNMSRDGGATWSETYFWATSMALTDVGVAVTRGYVYVGYAPHSARSEARIRRCFCRDGRVDSAYGFRVVDDVAPHTIEEVALTAIVGGHVYYAAIVSNGRLQVWGSTYLGNSWWGPDDPGYTDVRADLDFSWEYFGGSCHWGQFFSYIDARDRLRIVRHSYTSGWETVRTIAGVAPANRPGISAFDDLVICAYRPNAGGIKCEISYDCGDTWETETIAHGGSYYRPDVTTWGGTGPALVFQQWVNGSNDKLLFTRRDGYGPGPWNHPVQVNDFDVVVGMDTTVIALPPLGGAEHGYGLTYAGSDPVGNVPYFDRIDGGPGCTAPVLQSNFSAAANPIGTVFGAGSSTTYKAAGFTMAEDAVLECVTLTMDFTGTGGGGGGNASIEIWRGSAVPAFVIARFNSPPQNGVGDFTFRAQTPTTLDAGETYWLYVESIEDPTGNFMWRGTTPSTPPTGTASHVGYLFNGNPSTVRNRFEITAAPVPCPEDVNGDGVVDVLDLLDLLTAWGPCPPGPCPADVNGDGVVDVLDLLDLLTAWGPCG